MSKPPRTRTVKRSLLAAVCVLAIASAATQPGRTRTANHTSDALKLYEYFATGLPVIATPTAGFQRFPDLVTYWPAQPSLRDAVESLRQSATSRREVAQHSDWNERAAAMRQVLVTVAGLW